MSLLCGKKFHWIALNLCKYIETLIRKEVRKRRTHTNCIKLVGIKFFAFLILVSSWFFCVIVVSFLSYQQEYDNKISKTVNFDNGFSVIFFRSSALQKGDWVVTQFAWDSLGQLNLPTQFFILCADLHWSGVHLIVISLVVIQRLAKWENWNSSEQ